MAVKNVSSFEEWETILRQNPRVFVDFTAKWCAPCKVIGVKYDKLASMNPDIVFLRVDVDEVKQVAEMEQVTSMPTFKIYLNGKQEAPIQVGAGPPVEGRLRQMAKVLMAGGLQAKKKKKGGFLSIRMIAALFVLIAWLWWIRRVRVSAPSV